ncbi:MAG: lytic murein transglycosylase [Acidobacteria bacterium]|nr:lytic murein transglycosylase [Acidobacteriota bacterium]
MFTFIATLLALGVAAAQDARPSFADWLAGVRAEAATRGIRPEILEEALGQIEGPLQAAIDRDRAQPEHVLSLEQYLARVLTTKNLATGREMYARHRALLDQVGERYGVSPRAIVGIWGVESNFGRFSGTWPTIAALATLGWDPRRPTFFRGELFNALEILSRGDIDVAHMKGSWAGAMGQTQFMPSSYLQFAQDFDGDGRRDIWDTPADVFASIANFLKVHGWKAGQAWGREVRLTLDVARKVRSEIPRRNSGCQAARDMTVALPMERWQELGVRLPGGKPLPKTDLQASLVSGKTRAFLVYGNYHALLEYNCAHSYAVSVAMLGNAIISAPITRSGSPQGR